MIPMQERTIQQTNQLTKIIVSSPLRVALESYLTSILETELDADGAALAVKMDASLTHFVGPSRRSCPSLFESIEVYQRFRARRLCLVRVCAVQRRRFPVGASPTRQPLQPEAIGAVMEVTKWLKPSISVSQI